jgi:single-strand DNA-binding protein
VVLVGRLTRDPELRYTPNGIAVANFNIAVNRPFKDQNGENQADFINGVVWRKQAENLANYMKKGNQIGIDGRIQTRTYEGQDGKTVYVTEVLAESIQFLESKGSSQGSQGGGQNQSGNQQNSSQNNNQNNQNQYQNQGAAQNQTNNQNSFGNNQPFDISDDDLPF